MTHSYTAERFIWISDWLITVRSLTVMAACLDVCYICMYIYICTCVRAHARAHAHTHTPCVCGARTYTHTMHVCVCVYILVCIHVYFCGDVCRYSLSLFVYLFVECFLLYVTSLYCVLEFTLQCIYCTLTSSTPYLNTFWTFRNLFTTLNQQNAQYSSLDIYIISH
jgi:hypothetical protein